MISSKDILKNRILIVGSNGRLGQSLTEKLKNKVKTELLCCSIEKESLFVDVEYRQVDMTKKEEVKKVVLDFVPDFIINAAAYTNVDKCETEREIAWKVNVAGAEYFAQYARLVDAHITHISSDYVFDGEAGPYSETDKPNPISYYGRTKFASENALKISGTKYAIVRTNVLYGPSEFGNPDFVNWVIESLSNGKEINIVTDQINNPTFIPDLADGIIQIIDYDKDGVFNIGGAELLSRYDFTIRIADYFKLDKSLINKIKTSDLNQPAPRPLNSGLITLKAETELNYKPLSIEETFLMMAKSL
ncbi:MAG: dTDP-4-dehydrorhamnose reductase [Melioribacteraceae bacterium]|nr:dTDP-4-dehydrorhamnose reductase [Melioribacteraceae bacterium]